MMCEVAFGWKHSPSQNHQQPKCENMSSGWCACSNPMCISAWKVMSCLPWNILPCTHHEAIQTKRDLYWIVIFTNWWTTRFFHGLADRVRSLIHSWGPILPNLFYQIAYGAIPPAIPLVFTSHLNSLISSCLVCIGKTFVHVGWDFFGL